jgi:putative FmdB family regulatory protein
MPIYEYRCQTCQCRFDRYFASISEVVEEISCPECGGGQVRRLISTPAVQMGGGGGAESGGEQGTSAETPLFGRKELNEALGRRQDWASE